MDEVRKGPWVCTNVPAHTWLPLARSDATRVRRHRAGTGYPSHRVAGGDQGTNQQGGTSMQPISPLFDLSGRTALVTGGARGLGLAMARALGMHGARLAL